MYIDTHIYTHKQTHMHTHTHKHTYTHIYIHRDTHTETHTEKYTETQEYTHVHAYAGHKPIGSLYGQTPSVTLMAPHLLLSLFMVLPVRIVIFLNINHHFLSPLKSLRYLSLALKTKQKIHSGPSLPLLSSHKIARENSS